MLSTLHKTQWPSKENKLHRLRVQLQDNEPESRTGHGKGRVEIFISVIDKHFYFSKIMKEIQNIWEIEKKAEPPLAYKLRVTLTLFIRPVTRRVLMKSWVKITRYGGFTFKALSRMALIGLR